MYDFQQRYTPFPQKTNYFLFFFKKTCITNLIGLSLYYWLTKQLQIMTTKSEILHKAQNLMGQIVAAKKEKATPEKKAWEATLSAEIKLLMVEYHKK